MHGAVQKTNDSDASPLNTTVVDVPDDVFDAQYDHAKDIGTIGTFLSEAARRNGWANFEEVVARLNVGLTYPIRL